MLLTSFKLKHGKPVMRQPLHSTAMKVSVARSRLELTMGNVYMSHCHVPWLWASDVFFFYNVVTSGVGYMIICTLIVKCAS